MKVIKGICGFILFVCLVGMTLVPMMFEADTINLSAAILAIAVIALTALISFIGYIVTEKLKDQKIDFAEFIHQEYTKKNADERQLNRR